MMKTEKDLIILAIEAAVAGGSLSICKGENEIAGWTGPTDVSKAEDLLLNIDILLKESGVSKKHLDHVAVSAGPGSFTGIRIGIATALGLKKGLGISLSSFSALSAMARASGSQGFVTAALPTGRNAVCVQNFEVNNSAVIALDAPQTYRETDFFESGVLPHKTLVHAVHFSRYSSERLVDAGSNIAYFIARMGLVDQETITPPLFISKGF